MLKRAGTVVAIATVGLLMLNPLAYASEGKHKHVHQNNAQNSNQGNGAFNGNNFGSGNNAQTCNTNINGFNNFNSGGGNVVQNSQVNQGGGNCVNNNTVIGQNTQQNAVNNN